MRITRCAFTALLLLSVACDEDRPMDTPRRIELGATEFAFTPNMLAASPSEKLQIVLNNRGATAHNIEFELPSGGLELSNDVAPGASGEMIFNAPSEMGNYTFYCPIDNHRELGMVGTLRVGPAEPPPPERARVDLQLVAEGLTAPLAMVFAPGDSSRAFFVDQIGLVTIGPPTKQNGERTTFLDLRHRIVPLEQSYDERGLLGFAFHPNFNANGRVYAFYSIPLRQAAPEGFDHTNRVSEFRVMEGDANQIDPDSERVLFEQDWPQMNHNGGTLLFGPDARLYISTGDGGGANDIGLGHAEKGNGQTPDDLFGAILRFDVEDPNASPEVYAYGFRNPYRFSFDMGGDRALFAGDAGQELYEEVNIVIERGNYGWNIREGLHCFNPAAPKTPPESCATTGSEGEMLLDPIIELKNSRAFGDGLGNVVIGGHVYRGAELADLQGKYVFGAFAISAESGRGNLLVATPPDDEQGMLWSVEELFSGDQEEAGIPHFLLGFAEAPSGELYILTSDNAGPGGTTGRVYRLAPHGGVMP